ESKYNKDDSSFIHSLWGFRSCGFAIKKSYVVYAPQEFEHKVALWNNLSNLVTNFNIPSLVFGDFNEVREEAERLGSVFCHRGDLAFNLFILNSDLIDLLLGGRNFTRINRREPSMVISYIYNFHKAKFEDNSTPRPQFTSNLFKKISELDGSLLDAPFSLDEIKNAVWDCGGGKAPGPDGFTFKFIKRYWETIGKKFIDMVKSFEIDSHIPRVYSIVNDVQMACNAPLRKEDRYVIIMAYHQSIVKKA
nr:RNA-directed DNA polymerase, eukaryota [Tanacetum cinerariifolium]